MISQIISWPQTLTRICFDKPWIENINNIDLRMIQSWLQIHKATLKYIKIDELSWSRGMMWPGGGYGLGFNASNFPNLEHLHLSRWLWDSPLDLGMAKEDADSILGAPRLRVFVWDFTTSGEAYRERWTEFGAREEEWLRCFAQVAMSARQEGNCFLEEIRLRFTPEEVMGMDEDDEEVVVVEEGEEVYPWDRMDMVREEVIEQSSGLLALTYNEPVFSREEWKRDLELQREWRMRLEREGRPRRFPRDYRTLRQAIGFPVPCQQEGN